MGAFATQRFRAWSLVLGVLVVVLALIVVLVLLGQPQTKGSTGIHEDISKALAPVNPDMARLVADPTSTIEQYPAAFLKEYKIYQVQNSSQSSPVLFYVGYAPGKQAFFLTGSMTAYQAMAKADGVNIADSQTAADYAATGLETTRSMSHNFYVVKSVDDVKFQGNLDGQEAKVKDDFIQKYRSAISPPQARASQDGYTVTVYAVMDQALQQYTLTMDKNGDMRTSVETLEKDLPLLFGL